MSHRRYRGPEIKQTEGFNIIDDPNAEIWEGKEKFLKDLETVEREQAHAIKYLRSREYHYEGWRWPSDLASKVRVHNYKPSFAFINMLTGAVR